MARLLPSYVAWDLTRDALTPLVTAAAADWDTATPWLTLTEHSDGRLQLAVTAQDPSTRGLPLDTERHVTVCVWDLDPESDTCPAVTDELIATATTMLLRGLS